ncbi:MAG: adenylate/guanylate cyclase domain-containing protein [Chloroflexi bacterium]|nr:MAG: adenylate/guanylate cyclase domain-containing protein [Chloroflexota bacterium]
MQSTDDPQVLLFARDLARLNRLRRAYERLVPARLDTETPGVGEALVRDSTALFTDLRHFTRLMEGFADDPATVLRIVNEHLAVAVNAVTRCGGVVEKFVGDGLLATFGARTTQPDHRERAVAAAMGVVGANEALNRRRSATWGFRLEVGTGLASGPVVLGFLGPPERAELAVLGDPVNVAARLVARAHPGEVLLADSVYHGLAGTVRAELLGRRAVRGRAGKIRLYRVVIVERTRE